MTCPNGNLFNALDPTTRERIYWLVCVPTRLLLLFILVRHPIAAGSLAKIMALGFLLFVPVRESQWWSHQWLMIVSICILLVPLHQVSTVFAIAIAGGVVQALSTTFC